MADVPTTSDWRVGETIGSCCPSVSRGLPAGPPAAETTAMAREASAASRHRRRPAGPRRPREAFLAGLVLAAMFRACGAAGPHRVHLEAMENPTECIVWWMSPEETPASVVRYGTTRDVPLRAVADAPQFTYAENRGGQSYKSEYIHVVKLTNLPTGGVEVFYSAGHFQWGWSPVRSFHTRHDKHWSKVQILVLGDQDRTNDSRQVRDRILAENAQYSFAWLLGDFSYADGQQGEWDEHAEMMEPLFSRYPGLIGIGNHEREYKAYDAYDIRWRHANNKDNQYWFSLDEGPVHIFSMSCEHPMYPGSQQYKWLEEDLKRASDPNRRNEVPWIVGMTHRPAYTTGKANENDPFIGLVDTLGRKYGINLFLYGHDHHYDRSYPANDGKPTSKHIASLEDPYIAQRPFNTAGDRLDTVHIVAGTAGRKVRDCRKKKQYFAVQCINDHGFGVIEADRRQLVWTFKNTEGEARDAFKICSMPFCKDPPRPPGAEDGSQGSQPTKSPPPPASFPPLWTVSSSPDPPEIPPPLAQPPPPPPLRAEEPPTPAQSDLWNIASASVQVLPSRSAPPLETEAMGTWESLFNQAAPAVQGRPSFDPSYFAVSAPGSNGPGPSSAGLSPLGVYARAAEAPSPAADISSLPLQVVSAFRVDYAQLSSPPEPSQAVAPLPDASDTDTLLAFFESLRLGSVPSAAAQLPAAAVPPSPVSQAPAQAPQPPEDGSSVRADELEPQSMCDFCSLTVNPVCAEAGLMLAPNMCIAVACLGLDPAGVSEQFCP